jgi:WhiB family redox-sensing transcriptional regulator
MGTWDQQSSWRVDAACADADTDLFFPAGDTGPAAVKIVNAKAICRTCVVQRECLNVALTFYQEYGIWGGTTEEERRNIRRSLRRARAS